jgi:hypothetical protein
VRKFVKGHNSSVKQLMVKALILAFVSGIIFFFLVLQSAWWLVPGVLTWTAIFIWQDRREQGRNHAGEAEPDPNKKEPGQ